MDKILNNNTFLVILIVLVIIIFLYVIPDNFQFNCNENFITIGLNKIEEVDQNNNSDNRNDNRVNTQDMYGYDITIKKPYLIKYSQTEKAVTSSNLSTMLNNIYFQNGNNMFYKIDGLVENTNEVLLLTNDNTSQTVNLNDENFIKYPIKNDQELFIIESLNSKDNTQDIDSMDFGDNEYSIKYISNLHTLKFSKNSNLFKNLEFNDLIKLIVFINGVKKEKIAIVRRIDQLNFEIDIECKLNSNDEPELNELMTLNNNYFLIIEKNNDIVNNFMNKNKNRFVNNGYNTYRTQKLLDRLELLKKNFLKAF